MPEARDHGPLPALLVLLTVVTGLIDAFSYLRLGNVFVANVTGNILLFGFRLGGVGGTPAAILTAVTSTASFCAGAALGGRLALDRISHRGLLLSAATALQACVLVVSALFAMGFGHTDLSDREVLIAMLATSMGWQFAVVRRLDVPDFKTIVVTTTLTSLVADRAQSRERVVRKSASIAALLLGATAGPPLSRGFGVTAPLWSAAAVLLVVAAAGLVTARQAGAERWA